MLLCEAPPTDKHFFQPLLYDLSFAFQTWLAFVYSKISVQKETGKGYSIIVKE